MKATAIEKLPDKWRVTASALRSLGERAQVVEMLTDCADELDAAIALMRGQSMQMTMWHAETLAAARMLSDRMDEVHKHPRYAAVWHEAHHHLGPYDGPKYEDELARLRAAIIPPAERGAKQEPAE